MESRIVVSKEYTLILYQLQNYYGENIKPICQKYSDIIELKKYIEKEKENYKNDYWLYEIILTQVELAIVKKQKKYYTIKQIIDRVRLCDKLVK